MTRTHQLETTLTTLRLSGMLDTLQARLAQARAGELGHVEFLQVLCEDEIARREAAAIGRRIRQARFEAQATIEDFDFGYNPNIPVAQIRDLATLNRTPLGGHSESEWHDARRRFTRESSSKPVHARVQGAGCRVVAQFGWDDC